jgi:hypothetical protein
VSLCENLSLPYENFTYDYSLPRDQLHNSQVRRRTYFDALSAINIYIALNNVRPFRKKLDIVFHFVIDFPVFSVTHDDVMSGQSRKLYKGLENLTVEYRRHVTFHNYLLLPSSLFIITTISYCYKVPNNRQGWVK